MPRVCVIPGDGIGPEVIDACLDVLFVLDLNIQFEKEIVGTQEFKKSGSYMTTETLDSAQNADAILFGTLNTPSDPAYVSPLLLLRWNLDLFANVRPVKCLNPEFCMVPLDIVIIRENTEGLYGAIEREIDDKIITERVISQRACKRIIDFAFNYAVRHNRKQVSCVHKGNVLRMSDEMFRNMFYGVGVNFAFYNKIRSNDYYVDTAAMHLVLNPENFDMIVTLNLYGDILSDEAAGLVGGLGFAPSANIGENNFLFEPVHGSAPDIAGKGIANPTAAILSAAMMLDQLGFKDKTDLIRETLVEIYLKKENWTIDVGGKCGTDRKSVV